MPGGTGRRRPLRPGAGSGTVEPPTFRFSGVADAQLALDGREYAAVYGCLRALMIDVVAVRRNGGSSAVPGHPDLSQARAPDDHNAIIAAPGTYLIRSMITHVARCPGWYALLSGPQASSAPGFELVWIIFESDATASLVPIVHQPLPLAIGPSPPFQ